ncbi:MULTISPECIES: hypothetical protein [Streptomyces]|uniref:hypothetical protein n=1 Tax=Streptomyces TaxID=1883 RepID=UPI0015DA4698|nr:MULTISPECIES: hypothetical protein [Streptomyces]
MPVSAWTAARWSISPRLSAVGFSTSGMTPARIAAAASGAWVWGGVQMLHQVEVFVREQRVGVAVHVRYAEAAG